MERIRIDDTELEFEVRGEGEPVLLIPLSVIADGLGRPLLAQPRLASRYQLIHYHRRGYMGSSLGTEGLTTARQASDAAALLRHLGVKSAHIAGHSFGALIALQLAVDAPNLVHSLALLEPPLNMVPSGKGSFARYSPMFDAYHSGDKRQTFEMFGNGVFGPNWQAIVEQAVPGGLEQAVRDVGTFIKELPIIYEWQFGPTEAARITQPVLSVRGSRNPSPLMKEGRTLLHSWFPQTEDCDIDATHLLQMQDPQGVAQALVEFFSRHPMPVASIETRSLAPRPLE